jgi:Ca-activated chloride channel family protein
MKFAEPLWLIAGLAACALLWWRYRRFDRKQHSALTTFVSPHLLDQLTRSVSAGRRTLKRALVMAGVACLFVALARPQAGFRWEETHRKGLDILFAVDTSKSMLTQDVKPDRLSRAKLAVNDLVDKLNGDDVGLIAFAGDAFLQNPMTLDYDAFRESLNALDTSVIPRGGTDIARAISEAQTAFRTDNNHDKILVLVTDGEDLEGSAVTAAEAAAKDGVKIFTVGVGTTTGELIPVPAENGGTEFVKDASGQFVKSRLDEPMLRKIAAVTGGMYQPLGQRGEGLTTIYNQGLAPFQRHDLASRQHRVYLEQFQWPLLAALCCFLAEFLIGTRKRLRRAAEAPLSRKAVRYAQRRPKLGAPIAVGALFLAIFAWPGFVQASPQSAEKAYKKGDFAAAEQEYQAAAANAPSKTELDFNAGSAAYKAAMYDKAVEAFKKSLATDQLNLQQDTYYDLGNTQYRQGEQTEKTNPKQTIPIWQQAIQSYDAALQLKPGDADSLYNRDLVKKKLEKLQQQQQQQQSKDNKDQKDKDQKNQDQKSQDQAQQGQKSQDQKNQGQAKPDQNSQDQKNQGQAKPDQNSQDQKNQGQAKQDQKGQDQKNQAKQDQKGQDQKTQDQQQQAGKQPDQPKPGPGKDQADQQAKAGEQPQSPKPKGQDQANAGPKKDGSQEPAQAQPVPGQMTREEAKALLDSVKSDEQRLPAAPLARSEFKDDNKAPLKDW